MLGAMVLVGAMTAAVVALLTTRPGDPGGLRRFALRMLLYVVLPAWIVMLAAGVWLYHDEFGGKDNPLWVHIGVVAAEGGLVLSVVVFFLARAAARRARAGLGTAAGLVGAIALLGWVLAVWAMAAKPD